MSEKVLNDECPDCGREICVCPCNCEICQDADNTPAGEGEE